MFLLLPPLAFTEDMTDDQKSICLLYELKVSHESSLLDLLLAFRCLNATTTSHNSCSGSSCWQLLTLPVNRFFSYSIRGCTTKHNFPKKIHIAARLKINGSQQLLQLFPGKGDEPEAGASWICPKNPTAQQSWHPAIHVEGWQRAAKQTVT